MHRKLLWVSKTSISLSLLAAGSLVAQLPSVAQTNTAPQARVTQPVDAHAVVTLNGNTHPLAQPRFDVGAAQLSLPADRMLLILKRSAQQEADLRQFLATLQDPKSPNYRKYLTPEQFGQRYGVADSDVAAVTSWLKTEGFVVNKVNKARTVVEFSGNAGEIQSAFRTSIHSYEINGAKHYANATNPKIPAALAPVISGILGLNDFRPKPYRTPGPAAKYDPATKRFKPELTAPTSSGDILLVGPADAATIYNSPSMTLNANFASSGGIATLCGTSSTCDGTGATIGVIGDSNINIADNANYRLLFGLPANPVNVIIDGIDPGITGDSDEALLDTQIAGGLAPGAAIDLYVSADTTLQSGLFLAIQRALNDNVVDILNVSFGNCEFSLGNNNATLSAFWQQAAAQGITVTVATGDNGSAGCDDPSVDTTATDGLAVNGFASTPYDVAVGGTDFDILGTSFSTYVSSTNPAPPTNYGTVIGSNASGQVIPENPWNNSTSTNTTLANNIAFKDINNATNISAAGGGASNCSSVAVDTNGNPLSCNGGYSKPSWQAGLQSSQAQMNVDTARDIPDVSIFASNGFYGAAWAVCRDKDPTTGVTDCVPDSTGAFNIQGFGGTSTAAPAFAGILALVRQSTGARLGQADNVLYPLAIQNPAVFHDVTVGNNSVPCDATVTPALPNCGTNSFLTGFDSGIGYDLASGLGSVDITALIKDWGNVHFGATTTTLTLSSTTIVHGTPVTVNSTVTPNTPGGTPTGDVAVVTTSTLVNNAAQGFLTLNITGSATGTINYFPGGTYQVSGRYSGDANFASSASTPTTLTVTPEASVTNFFVYANGATVAAGNPSFTYGTAISALAQPAGVSNPAGNGIATGTVTFADNVATVATLNLNSIGLAEYDTGTAAIGAHSLGVTYNGDASFLASPAVTPVAFTIMTAPTTTTVASSAPSVAGTGLVTLTANIATSSYGAGPSGTVSFFSGSTLIISSATVTPVDGSPTTRSPASAQVIATVQASVLSPGANTITAVYSGDTNYEFSTSTSTTVTVNGAFTFTASAASPASIAAGGSTTSTLTVTPAGGLSGTVNFACSVKGANASDVHTPTCAAPSITIPSGSTAAVTGTATIKTTATTTTTASLRNPPIHPDKGWLTAGGGALLACVVFFGIPARRRSWRAMLGILVFLAAITFSGCGGGGSSGGGTTTTTVPGTTADTYTVTVTASDSTGAITSTTTFTFTVN